jgi:hypothetical protein
MKRPDYNELFSIKLSPFHKFHASLTNGKTDGDNILFVNIRDGYSVYGAAKGWSSIMKRLFILLPISIILRLFPSLRPQQLNFLANQNMENTN